MNLLLHIQNISLFIIGLSSLFAFFYSKENETKLFDMIIPIIGVHALIDLYFNKSIELKMHHTFVLNIIFYNYFYNVIVEDRYLFIYSLLKTEISSIFYVLKYWISINNILYYPNMLFFYISFFKFRIVDMYFHLLTKNLLMDTAKYTPDNIYMSYFFIISIYGLYALNIYWFLIINKILFKKIFGIRLL
jgi:hypothetical protein